MHLVPSNPQMKCNELIAEIGQKVMCNLGNRLTVAILHSLIELNRAPNSLGNHKAELGQQTSQHVSQLGPLANNQITCAV